MCVCVLFWGFNYIYIYLGPFREKFSDFITIDNVVWLENPIA